MTLANLRTLIRAMIPGAKVSVITNTVLDLILNNGVRDIAAYTACLKTNETFDVVADDDEYDLSTEVTDFLVMDKPGLWWNAGTAASPNWLQLHPRTLKYFDKHSPSWRDDDSDDPQEYSIDGDVVTIRPAPDTSLTDGFWIYYGAAPTAMSAAASYPFSGSTTHYTHLDVFDDAILAYAEWQLQKMLNKGQDPYKLKETAYVRIREEKFSLFKRRLDISASKDAKLQGRKIRS